MSLSRFEVTSSFCAWSPKDRDRPEGRIFIAPGSKDLFTDETERAGAFIKFLRRGSWYEAGRNEFGRSTIPVQHEEGAAIGA